MNAAFERVVRDAVNDLADEGRAVNLATAAIRQGRRTIVRRRIISVAAAVAATAALAVPFALANRGSPPLQPGAAAEPSRTPMTAPPEPAPSPSASVARPFSVPSRPVMSMSEGVVNVGGGWLLIAAPSAKGMWILDRSRQAYRQIPYGIAHPAPTGDLVAVSEAGRVGLYNMRTNSMRWISGPANVVGTFDWSADGSRLLYPVEGKGPDTVRLGVVDVSTHRLKVLNQDIECLDNCAPAWLPNTKEIAFAPGPVAVDSVVHIYSANDGTMTRKLPLPGPIPALHSWSPDGSMVAVQVGEQTQIVDGRTGAEVLAFSERADGVYWQSAKTLLVVRREGVATYDLSGDLTDFYPKPDEVVEDDLPRTIIAKG
jgi:hypothetical protein